MPGVIDLYNLCMGIQLVPARKIEIREQKVVLLAPDDQRWGLHLRDKALRHPPVQVAFQHPLRDEVAMKGIGNIILLHHIVRYLSLNEETFQCLPDIPIKVLLFHPPEIDRCICSILRWYIHVGNVQEHEAPRKQESEDPIGT